MAVTTAPAPGRVSSADLGPTTSLPAVMRPFVPETDLKIVRYLVGASVMEPSSVANQQALRQPIVLLAWAALSHLAVTQLHKGWPASVKTLARTRTLGEQTVATAVVEWIWVIPFLVVPAIALLSLFELRHRAMFEKEMTRAVGEEDMRDIQGYYGLTDGDRAEGETPPQRSGFWVLEVDNRIIGAVGLDGRKPGAQLDSMVDIAIDNTIKGQDETITDAAGPGAGTASAASATAASPNLRPRPMQKLETARLPTPRVSITPPTPSSATFASASTVQLRRFAASPAFRPSGTEGNLLRHAADAAFGPASSPSGKGSVAPAHNIVVAVRPSVQGEFVRELVRAGFELVPEGGELELEVEREGAGAGVGPVGQLVRLIWPLDLGWRTYVLSKNVWKARKAVDNE